MNKETAICDLKTPAQCSFKVDGKFAWVDLCGGNRLDDAIKDCPYRLKAVMTTQEATNVDTDRA